jgi:hypothetical protein
MRKVGDAFVAVTRPTHWRAALDRSHAEDLPGIEPSPPSEAFYE